MVHFAFHPALCKHPLQAFDKSMIKGVKSSFLYFVYVAGWQVLTGFIRVLSETLK
jgi:hypothetical protein